MGSCCTKRRGRREKPKASPAIPSDAPPTMFLEPSISATASTNSIKSVDEDLLPIPPPRSSARSLTRSPTLPHRRTREPGPKTRARLRDPPTHHVHMESKAFDPRNPTPRLPLQTSLTIPKREPAQTESKASHSANLTTRSREDPDLHPPTPSPYPRDSDESTAEDSVNLPKSSTSRTEKTQTPSTPCHQSSKDARPQRTGSFPYEELWTYHTIIVTSLTNAILASGYNTFTHDATVKRGLVGLENLGNTCYFNSCLQALLHTPPVRQLFLAPFLEPAQSFIPRINPANKESAASRGTLPSSLSAFFGLVWEARPDGSRPVKLDTFNLHQFVSIALNAFQNRHQQQDAQECLLHILEILAEDLNLPLHVLLPSTEVVARMSLVEQERLAWGATRARYRSSIDDLLLSHETAINTCSECFFRSYSFSPIRMLSLEVPLPSEVESTGGLELKHCLDSYYRAELVENLSCERCGGQRRAWHQLFLGRFPNLLILHLKRFHGPTMPKVTTLVRFPLQGLRLDAYTRSELRGDGVRDPGYDLVAVITHSGTLSYGHYTASVAGEDGAWHLLDDTSVRPILDPLSSLPNNAYLLFYLRRNLV